MKKLLGVFAILFLVGCIPPRYYSASQVIVIEYRSVGYDYYGYGYVSSRYYSPYYYYYSPGPRHVTRTHNYVSRTSSRKPKQSSEVKPTTYRKRQPVVSRPPAQIRRQPQRRTPTRRRN